MFKDPKFISAIVTILAGVAAHFGLDIPVDTISGVVAVVLGIIFHKPVISAVKTKIAKKKD